MKPCIFLDIDGVINPNRKNTTYHFDYSLPNTLAKKLNHPKISNLNVYLVNQVYSCFSKESIDYFPHTVDRDSCGVDASLGNRKQRRFARRNFSL